MAGEKILIVDDTGFARVVIENTLTPLKLEFHHARSGAEALHQLARIRFNLVITDYLMPEMDGLTLFRRALSSNFSDDQGKIPCPPFILITAHNSRDLEDLARHMGIAAVIQKPNQGVDLAPKVQALLGGGITHLDIEVREAACVRLQKLATKIGVSEQVIGKVVLNSFLSHDRVLEIESLEDIAALFPSEAAEEPLP